MLWMMLWACQGDDFTTAPLSVRAWGGEEAAAGFTGDAAFIDGWEITFSSWVSTLGGVQVNGEAHGDAVYAADWVQLEEPATLFELEVEPGEQTVTFSTVAARADATALTDIPAGVLEEMERERWNHMISGIGDKSGIQVGFRWGIGNSASYSDCDLESPLSLSEEDLVVEKGELPPSLEADLRVDVGRLFMDRLDSRNGDLRFAVIAAWVDSETGRTELDELGEVNTANILDPDDDELLDEDGYPLSYSNAAMPLDTFMVYNLQQGIYLNEADCQVSD